MDKYFDTLQSQLSGGKELSNKILRKALLTAFQHYEDLLYEGAGGLTDIGSGSSGTAGSEIAPSEDNLEPEEIEKVIPIDD